MAALLPTRKCGGRRMTNAQIDAKPFRAEYCEMLLAAGVGKDIVLLHDGTSEIFFSQDHQQSHRNTIEAGCKRIQ